jgi:diguanylate cyclase (GGDEF)-like protein
MGREVGAISTGNADLPSAKAGIKARPSGTLLGRLADAVLGTDSRRRIRTGQWAFSLWVYVASAFVLWFNMRQQEGYEVLFLGWCVFVAVGLALVYAALRSGWSERFADPALTTTQIALGVLVVEWGYLICGPARSLTLFPLLLIFVFGAFSLDWRRITLLTLFALASLVACVATLHVTRSGIASWSLRDADLRLDLSNVLMVLVLLPAVSLVAARLSSLRSRLRSQRAALTQALREVQRLAIHDELTGLANRRHMQERLEQEKSRCQRTGRQFSIAVIDLDHFKRINDSLGHAGGDAVLRAFAAATAATMRGADLMARWGGEEFLLLLPDTPGAQAQAVVMRLLERVRTLPCAADLPMSFSAGVTEHHQDESVSDTVARADRQMYEAKRAGRNTVRLQLAEDGAAKIGG